MPRGVIIDDWFDDEHGDTGSEPIGSCDRCSSNIYEDEDGPSAHEVAGELLCDQCAFYIKAAAARPA